MVTERVTTIPGSKGTSGACAGRVPAVASRSVRTSRSARATGRKSVPGPRTAPAGSLPRAGWQCGGDSLKLNHPPRRESMQRREALRLIGTAAAIPALGGLSAERLWGLAQDTHDRADAFSRSGLGVLDPHQLETIATIGDII